MKSWPLLNELGWQSKISAHFTCSCQRSLRAEKLSLFGSYMLLLCGGQQQTRVTATTAAVGTASPQHRNSFSSLWSSPSRPISFISLQRSGSIKPVSPRSKSWHWPATFGPATCVRRHTAAQPCMDNTFLLTAVLAVEEEQNVDERNSSA